MPLAPTRRPASLRPESGHPPRRRLLLLALDELATSSDTAADRHRYADAAEAVRRGARPPVLRGRDGRWIRIEDILELEGDGAIGPRRSAMILLRCLPWIRADRDAV